MIPSRLRAPLAAAGAALILLLAFPESLGLWPLRLVAAWPGEIGRAVGGLIFAGRLGPLALSQASELELRGPAGRQWALAIDLGLLVQLAAGLALFWLAERPKLARWVLLTLAGAAGLAAIVPPMSAVSAAELGAALALALAAASSNEVAPGLGARFLAGAMVASPIADIRPALLFIGRPLGPVSTLESQSGIPAVIWALLIAAGVVVGLLLLLRAKPAKVRPA